MIEDNRKVNSDKKNENALENEDEPWNIAQFFTLDKLQDKCVAACDNDECNLHDLLAC